MKVFKEYLLDEQILTPQTICLPYAADVVNIIDTAKGPVLLAIVTPEEFTMGLPELRTFKICVNDENIYANTVKYIGSFVSSIGIKHIIEINRGEF
jgi:hypothetical protein